MKTELFWKSKTSIPYCDDDV